LPFKFEAGTPNIAGIIAFSSAIEFINENKINQKFDHKNQLTDYCYEQLASLTEIQFVVQGKPDIPLFSFLLNKHHHQDVSSSLDLYGIAVRVGHHCAMPLMEYLNISGCIRISLAPYNTFEEVDYFINTLKHILKNKDKQLSSSIDTKSYDSLVTSEEILYTFSKAKSWDAKHREIMLLGKTLKRMPKDLRSNETLILGCESAAWLSISKSPEGIFSFEADSDAKIIRGLLVIVLAALNNQTAEKITQINIDEYFLKLGLIQHLSPSRGNGLLAIVNKIRHSVL
jgi:cysteine desulfurase/selenocysteine lyase